MLKTVETRKYYAPNNSKQLLDEVFVISRIVKVEVRVISRRLRLITLSEIESEPIRRRRVEFIKL